MSEAPTDFETFVHRGDTEFMQVFVHPDRALVLAVRRQGVPLPAEDVQRAHSELFAFAPEALSSQLIIDTRPVTGNNDERFEAAIARSHAELLAHFRHIVVLVRSTIGKLHAVRLSGTGLRTTVTSDALAALEMLRSSSD